MCEFGLSTSIKQKILKLLSNDYLTHLYLFLCPATSNSLRHKFIGSVVSILNQFSTCTLIRQATAYAFVIFFTLCFCSLHGSSFCERLSWFDSSYVSNSCNVSSFSNLCFFCIQILHFRDVDLQFFKTTSFANFECKSILFACFPSQVNKIFIAFP